MNIYIITDLDDFRHKKNYFESQNLANYQGPKVVCIEKYWRGIYSIIYIYIFIVLGDYRNPPQAWTLYLRYVSLNFHYVIISQGICYFTGIFNT